MTEPTEGMIWECTPRLRWLHERGRLAFEESWTLQQAWRQPETGVVEWRTLEIVEAYPGHE